MEPALKAILLWLQKNPLVFQWSQENDWVRLREMATGKVFALKPAAITDYRLTAHPQGLADYLNVILENDVQIVLCHAGLAFAPDTTHTGPLPDCPPVACLSDYYQMFNHLVDLTSDESLAPQALQLFQVLIAVLDGAKKIGLDVAAEEAHLDKQLTSFEKTYT